MYKMWANIPFEVASEFILEWRITVNIPLPENIFSFFLLALCKKKKGPVNTRRRAICSQTVTLYTRVKHRLNKTGGREQRRQLHQRDFTSMNF